MGSDPNGVYYEITKSDIKELTWLEALIEEELHHYLEELWLKEHDKRTLSATWLAKPAYAAWYRAVRASNGGYSIVLASPNKGELTPSFSPIDKDSISIGFNRSTRKFSIDYKHFLLLPLTEKEFKSNKLDKNSSHFKYDYDQSHIEMTLAEVMSLFE